MSISISISITIIVSIIIIMIISIRASIIIITVSIIIIYNKHIIRWCTRSWSATRAWPGAQRSQQPKTHPHPRILAARLIYNMLYYNMLATYVYIYIERERYVYIYIYIHT